MSFEGQVVQSSALCPASLSIKGLKYLASHGFYYVPSPRFRSYSAKNHDTINGNSSRGLDPATEDCYLLPKHVDYPYLDFKYDLLPSNRWEKSLNIICT